MIDCPSILRKNETSRRVGLSIRQLERLERAGHFPSRIRLAGNSAGWIEAEVAEWLNQRIATARGTKTAPAAR